MLKGNSAVYRWLHMCVFVYYKIRSTTSYHIMHPPIVLLFPLQIYENARYKACCMLNKNINRTDTVALIATF